ARPAVAERRLAGALRDLAEAFPDQAERDLEVPLLAAHVEPHPPAEPVGERGLLAPRLALVDLVGPLPVRHVGHGGPVRGRPPEPCRRQRTAAAPEWAAHATAAAGGGVKPEAVEVEETPGPVAPARLEHGVDVVELVVRDLDQPQAALGERRRGGA